jgi:cysteinyl-tRNA synthetase
MQLYNTKTRQKEDFTPREPGKVAMYVCGITAYDYCHIGHARAAVVFDVLVRYLRFLDYEVCFVRNFTDVDDKIINKASEEGLSSSEVAQKYIAAFYEDMDKLNVLRADIEPKATEHIQDMIALTEKLLSKGYAYETESGDVYFKVRSFNEYGRLSGSNIEELRSGARIAPGEEKQDALDFALWKHAKPDEPYWPSPWGNGRPGWHLECSAMSERYLGLPMDIHGGGQDLAFPHHENERAQSVAAAGKEFVRYWIHNGFVKVNEEKMSKSLGNFVTLRDIFKYYLPESLRFFLISQHYRSPLDFSWEALDEAEKGLKRIYQTKKQIEDALARNKWSTEDLPAEFDAEIKDLVGNWSQSMNDDLNTAAALGHTFHLVRLANRILEDKTWRKSAQARDIFKLILEKMHAWGAILGVFNAKSTQFLEDLRKRKAVRKGIDIQKALELIEDRQKARQEKDFARADSIRDELHEMHIEVKDTPQGPVWDVL